MKVNPKKPASLDGIDIGVNVVKGVRILGGILVFASAVWGFSGKNETRENVTCMRTFSEGGKCYAKFAHVLPERPEDSFPSDMHGYNNPYGPRREGRFTVEEDCGTFEKDKVYDMNVYFPNLFGDNRVESYVEKK